MCEHLYKRDGFVKWTEVAELLGVTRQAVFNRLNDAVKRGRLSAEDLDRWRSSASRRAQSRQNIKLKKESEKLRISITLTPDNKRWIAYQCEQLHCISSDIINGLINLEREKQQ